MSRLALVLRNGLVSIAATAALLFPATLAAQTLGRDALGMFPADTTQVTYSNLAELRDLPDFAEIRPRLINQQMKAFEDFLRSLRIDPEKDVDEIMLGWRGEMGQGSLYFGAAKGRFHPNEIRKYFAGRDIPRTQEFNGTALYPFGSGEDRDAFYFSILDTDTAAFGRRSDLEAILDVRAGNRTALDANPDFVAWEGELEGSAPQWGVASGSAARNEAAPWLAGGANLPVDPSAFLGPIRAVLYRVEWASGFTARLSIVCKTADNATALAKLISTWKSARQAAGANTQPGIATFLQSLDVQANAERVELSGSGPIEAIEQVFRGPVQGSS